MTICRSTSGSTSPRQSWQTQGTARCGTLVNADGRVVPVRLVGEQHVREDLGSIPSFADWARLITPQAWMLRGNPLDGAEG